MYGAIEFLNKLSPLKYKELRLSTTKSQIFFALIEFVDALI